MPTTDLRVNRTHPDERWHVRTLQYLLVPIYVRNFVRTFLLHLLSAQDLFFAGHTNLIRVDAFTLLSGLREGCDQ